MNETYWPCFKEQIDAVFRSHTALYDHRQEHPWLTGALGDPTSGNWFIAENPSLTQVERFRTPDGSPPTPEAQWSASPGDRLFRDMLVEHGFKLGTADSPGGWNCYITNVVKEADYSSRWHEKTQPARNRAAEIWAPVLAWELANSRPKYVAIFGAAAETLLKVLQSIGKIRLPPHERIKHCAYLGQRAEGSLGPLHPTRIAAYRQDFARLRARFDSL